MRALLILSTILFLFPEPTLAEVQNLYPAEANTFLQKDKNVFILDVRTPEEYRRSRLVGGKLIPIDIIEKRLDEIPTDRPILVYCAVGSRSSKVAALLERRGFAEIYNLVGGIWAWQLGGYPVLTGGP